MELKVIAYARNGFSQKFGIPRQSREDSCLETCIVFAPTYRVREALRGIEDYSHLWLLWGFHEAIRQKGDDVMDEGLDWSPTVRPPRLGGNKRMGVFATRSPFRPNPIGLTSVKLLRVEETQDEGVVLVVSGADLLNGTPIYDIKPYISYADSRPHAVCGYVDCLNERYLKVVIPPEMTTGITDKSIMPALVETLRLDPRPSYHDDPERVYGLSFAGYNVRFTVSDGILHVVEIRQNSL